ncbi:MAG: Asp-tRNA(Asn)/Glu-tRNA(Gln) amidotransferase subunit GatB [Candidatus Omnitrophica bacterium]|nr:Asp-tRNA(Asn)/Glu-tRNA(Gln) amidotransferase subunit GatB [Candidatus Omnitrophota bacterium]
MSTGKYEAVIGLEVHVQLNTQSKIFCSCRNRFGDRPNANTCPVCLGLPGSLPVLNRKVLESAIKVGLALNCHVAERMKFDRKNYFYPDLPKAYQISQFDMPVSAKGYVDIMVNGEPKKIGITRAHVEEDAGKLLHEGIKDGSNVDYNRTGTPLIEIVSEPDMRMPEEAYEYLTALKAILQYLEVSDCNMEEGSLRCDANVSIRPRGQKEFGVKAEIKNLNSFKAVARAIQYEIDRQTDSIEEGDTVVQETRLWNDAKGVTTSMRSKEEAHDYRYFPEPDLVPFVISREIVSKIKATMPELPRERQQRFVDTYGITVLDAAVLTQEKRLADFYEETVACGSDPKAASNWIANELLGQMKQRDLTIATLTITPKAMANLIQIINKGLISGKIGKDVLGEMFSTDKLPEEIVKAKGLLQISDEGAIARVIDEVIAAHQKSVDDYRAGKKNALGFLVGQVMQKTKGKANPALVNKILTTKLEA